MRVMKTKPTVRAGGVFLVLLLVAFLVRQPRARPSGISLSYLGSQVYPTGWTARLLASNRTELAALVYQPRVEICSNGSWVAYHDQNFHSAKVLPHQTEELRVHPPGPGVTWRVLVIAAEEKRGWASIVPRVKRLYWNATDQLRVPIRFLFTGPVYDYGEAMSQEITTK